MRCEDHTQQISKAAVLYDAMAIRKQILSLRQRLCSLHYLGCASGPRQRRIPGVSPARRRHVILREGSCQGPCLSEPCTSEPWCLCPSSECE